jgi:Ca2+-binding EF-hand superfamily protein
MSNDRDFVVFRRAIKDSTTGATAIVLVNCKHPDAKPVDGFERGRMLGGAWVVTPDKTGRKCSLIHVVRLDLIGGWTGYPALIINTVHTRQAGLVTLIKSDCELRYVPSASDMEGPAVLMGLFEETDSHIEKLCVFATENSAAWTSVKEAGGIIVQKRTLAPSFLLHRATFVLPLAPMALVQDLWSVDSAQKGACRKTLDKRVMSEKRVHSFDDRMDICHFVIDSDSIRLANRDYVMLRRWNNRNANVVYVEKSCTHPSVPKVSDNPLRVEILLAGVFFAQDSSGGSAITILVQQNDPGWGPSDPDYINVENMAAAMMALHGSTPTATGLFSGVTSLLPDVVSNALPSISLMSPSLLPQASAQQQPVNDDVVSAAQSGLYETVSPQTQMTMESLVLREQAVVVRLFSRHALPQPPGSSNSAPAVSAARFTVLFSELVLVFNKNMTNEEVVDTLENVVNDIPGNITQPEFLSWWMQNSANDRQAMCDAFRRAWGLADSGNEGYLSSTLFFSLVKQFCSVGVAHPVSLGAETLNKKVAEINQASQGLISLSDGIQWFLASLYSLQITSAENLASMLDRCNPKRSLIINPAPVHALVEFVVPNGSAGAALLDCKAAGSAGGDIDWLHLVAWLYKGMRSILPRPWGSKDEAFEQQVQAYLDDLRAADADFLKSVFDRCDSSKTGRISFGSVCDVMQQLGLDPRLVPWGSGVRKNSDGSVSWGSFVLGLGPWLVEQNRLSAIAGASSQGSTMRSMADVDYNRGAVLQVALEVFRTHCSLNGGLGGDRFVSCVLCAAVSLGRQFDIQELQACAQQLTELDTQLTEDEFADWWSASMDADDVDTAFRIKAVFDKVSYKFRRNEIVDSEAFSAGILELITAFPYADIAEDTILQYMYAALWPRAGAADVEMFAGIASNKVPGVKFSSIMYFG